MAANNTFIWSTAPLFTKTPEDLQWKLDADKAIELKGKIAALEEEYKALAAKLLDAPKAEEYLNTDLGKKISFFLDPKETKIDTDKAYDLLTKKEFALVATISVSALSDKLGNPVKAAKVLEAASYTSPKSAFIKVGNLAKDDKARVQAAINSGSQGFGQISVEKKSFVQPTSIDFI